MVLICAVVLAFMFRLAQYKGIPNSLVWIAVVIAVYTYIASKTTVARYFYAVGGNIEAARLLVSVQEELNIWYLHYQDFLQDLPVLYFVTNKFRYG